MDHYPAAPDRAPILNKLSPLPQQLPGAFATRETIWPATPEEPGQHWYTMLG